MSPASSGPVITRFAPSPTAHLHIGGARSALFCWAFAKRAEREHIAKGGTPGQGGRFMLRIEDTDAARSSDESARGIMEDLAWLGIEWDDGPKLDVNGRTIGAHARDVGSYFQAQRVPIYNKYIHQLVEHGKAYPAFETSEELDAKRKAVVALKQTYRYDRAEYKRLATPAARLAAMAEADKSKTPYVIRFFMPDDDIIVHDEVLGDVKYSHKEGGIDDFVIRKADGFPTYHFAVVVDDETMGVTHVMRAQEHLNNTPRHVALQKALGFRTPSYAHMPLIFNMDSTKMSKRDKAKHARKAAKDAMAKDKSITAATIAARSGVDEKLVNQFLAAENDSLDIAAALAKAFNVTLPEIEVWDFRKNGYLPEAIINFIGLLGWNPGMKLPDGKDLEKFDMDFLATHFSVDRIGKTSARFDRAKLLSFNGDYIAALPDAEFAVRWRDWLAEYEPDALAALDKKTGGASSPRFSLLAVVIKPRAKTLRDGLNSARFVLLDDAAIAFDPKSGEKALGKKDPAVGGPSGLDLLAAASDRLSTLPAADWTAPAINTLLEQLAQQNGVQVGGIAQPLRFALTGTGVSPGIGETLAILGRDSALKRIERCLSVHRQ